MGTPACDGDGLRLAGTVGADLANMAEGWWMPALAVPGEELDGARYYRPLHSERAYPGAIMVDGTGKRFVDEAQNSGDVGRAMASVGAPWWWLDLRQGMPPSLPGGAPRARRSRSRLAGPGGRLSDLAAAIGVSGRVLAETVAGFNDGAGRGVDPASAGALCPMTSGSVTLRPLPHVGPTRRGPLLRAPGPSRLPGDEGGTADRRPGSGARGRGVGDRRSLRRGQRGRQPLRPGHPGRRIHLGPALVFGYRAGEAAGGDG